MITQFLRNLDHNTHVIHEPMFDEDAHLHEEEIFHSCSCGHNLSKEEAIFIGKQAMGRKYPNKFINLYNCPYCHTTFSKR